MTRRSKFYVPIFDVTVTVIVTNNLAAAYRREFGQDAHDLGMACMGWEGNRFCLFFEPKTAERREIVAHEIFHLTHRILERCCMNFDPGHHEIGAYLNEWLTKKVFAILERKKKRP